MTPTPAPAAAPRPGLNIATLGLALAICIQFAVVVANTARVEARVTELGETVEPLRRGDLVKVERDVAWIREHLERQDRQ